MDHARLAEQIFGGLRAYLERAVAPIIDRLRAVETKVAERPQKGDPGKDADPEMVMRVVKDVVSLLPNGRDGKDAQPVPIEVVSALVAGEVAKAAANFKAPAVDHEAIRGEIQRLVDAIPRPQDGKDADAKAIADEVLERVIGELEKIPAPKDGKDGKDADPESIKELVFEAVASMPKPENGKDADPAMVELAVRRAFDAMPKPKDGENGKDADPEAIAVAVMDRVTKMLPSAHKDADSFVVAALVSAEVSKAIAALPKAENGKDADPALMQEMVEKAVAAIPRPQDGKDGVSKAEVAEMVAKAVADVPKPKDGESVTLEQVRPLLEAEVARWEVDFERRAMTLMQRAIDRMPLPKDGKDGLGFEDMSLEYDGERSAVFKWQRGDEVKEKRLHIPALIYRGVWTQKRYEKGDAVTWGGSVWVAECDTDEPPRGPSSHWKLAVKSGRDAK